MRVYRASRRPRVAFDPLDSSASVARDGWRFNDKRSEILYTAEVQSLSILEIAARPGWDTVSELTIAAIEVPDGTVFDLSELGIVLPSNWNLRPAGPNAQSIGGEFLEAVDREAAAGRRVCGVRVPSVISTTDHNILLDPRQKASFSVASWARIPFDWLVGTATQLVRRSVACGFQAMSPSRLKKRSAGMWAAPQGRRLSAPGVAGAAAGFSADPAGRAEHDGSTPFGTRGLTKHATTDLFGR